ncbi:hypothetical protein RIF29_20566 [Crotalaria pallida]|uniref:AT-hook motif nuclear-localized protein n=1 Tax=Crotalaria pallida TaxID=3830 RepID=A0AAN9F4S1_CROPI
MEEEKMNNTVSATGPLINMDNNNNGGATTTTTTTVAPQSSDLFGKKKRGRPRKYDADGNLNIKYQNAKTSPPPGFAALSPTTSPSEFSSSYKRGRGRSTNSTNWQLLSASSFGEAFANTAGADFTPYVVTVYTGQDVAGKIMSFAQKGPGGICILSANGTISNVAMRQSGSSGGILTYEA